MASAGRPLTERALVRLMARGVPVAPVTLHTGVASQEPHEPPQPERFTVPAATARLVDSTLAARRRVVAVGTTVVRALESARRAGRVHADHRLDVAGPRAGATGAGRSGACSPDCTRRRPAISTCSRRLPDAPW